VYGEGRASGARSALALAASAVGGQLHVAWMSTGGFVAAPVAIAALAWSLFSGRSEALLAELSGQAKALV
jgi:hypothetical protein